MRYLSLVLGLLPPSRQKNWLLNRLPGFTVAGDAVVHCCFLIGVRQAILGSGAVVGLGTVMWNLQRVNLGKGASVGHLNWISASPVLTNRHEKKDLSGSFEIGDGAQVMSRHHIDCSGGVFIGSMTVLAGWKTVIVTHNVDVMTSTLLAAPVTVGHHCLVGTNCLFLPGTQVADRIVVGAGSVIPHDLDRSGSLYVGNPATWKRGVVEDATYFTRTRGPVDPAAGETP